MNKIYLDNNATTSLDPKVLQIMLAELSGPPANPSSVHFFGQRARSLLSQARQRCASFFGVKPEGVLFTSGGTEAINWMIRSIPSLKGHILTSNTEHSAVYKTLQTLQADRWIIEELPSGLEGVPLPTQIEKAIRPDTRALVFSAANSETGVKLDFLAVAAIAEKYNIPFLLDAVGFIGKEPFRWPPGLTALALSAHKFHGPKGVGALVLRSPQKLPPLFTGGAQEFQKRSGTENLAGILGLAEALTLLSENQETITSHLLSLRTLLEQTLLQELPDTLIHGRGNRISNTLSVAFPGIDGETLLMQLDLAGIAVSHGSACSSGALEPSRVLTNMGLDKKIARSSIRISLARTNTKEEVKAAAKKLIQIVKSLKKIS